MSNEPATALLGSSKSSESSLHLSVVDFVFKELQRLKKCPNNVDNLENKRNHLLHILEVANPSMMHKAVQILDSRKVSKYQTENGNRVFYRVEGTKEFESYLVFSNFCTCPYFVEEAINKSNTQLCKHLFAIRFLEAYSADGCCHVTNCDDFEFSDQLTLALSQQKCFVE